MSRELPLWRDALRSVLVLGPLFFLLYGLSNVVTSWRVSVPSFYFPWEERIPFVAWMIVPYMSIDLLFVGAFFAVPNRGELCVLRRRIEFCYFVSVALFLLMPLRVAFERPETSGVPGFLFAILGGADLPFNQCPSLHISLMLVLWGAYRDRLRGALRSASALWFALIGASTLFVYQHHFIDLIGGALVGLAAVGVLPSADAQGRVPARPGMDATIGLRYLAGVAALCVPVGLWPGACWWLVWPIGSLAIVASGYLAFGAGVVGKRDGVRSLPVRLVLAPWLVGGWLVHQLFYRHRVEPFCEIAPPTAELGGVYLGRVPSGADVAALRQAGIGAVLDLTAEMPVAKAVRELRYRNVPLLDFTAPDAVALRGAIEFIEIHRRGGARGEVAREGRGVLVHCALGLTRGALVASAWLAARSGHVDRDGAAVRLALAAVRARRPGVRLPQSLVEQLVALVPQVVETGESRSTARHPPSTTRFSESGV